MNQILINWKKDAEDHLLYLKITEETSVHSVDKNIFTAVLILIDIIEKKDEFFKLIGSPPDHEPTFESLSSAIKYDEKIANMGLALTDELK